MMYENTSGEYTSKPAKMIHDQAYVLGVLDINNDTYPDLVTVTFSDANLYFLIYDQDNTLIESNQTAYVDLATMIEFEIVDYNLDG